MSVNRTVVERKLPGVDVFGLKKVRLSSIHAHNSG